VSLLCAAALAIAAFLAVPSGAAADVCPPGQSGMPPYCTTPPPPNCPAGQVGTPPNCVVPAFSIVGTKAGGQKLTVTFEVNAAGTLTVSGAGIASKSVDVAPGEVKIKLTLTSAAKRALKKKGKVKLKLSAVYQPGADPQTKSLTVIVKKPGKRRGHHA
jgi:hypothetical protein